jgi:ParB/RepB/Spo0J family partition protein
MNAPTKAVEIAEPKVELIPVAAIAPSETHIQQLRRKRYDMEALANLTASIVKLGVQQPGVVRKLKAMRGMASYELVAGERRWRASRQAGVAHFPAIVRELDDATVLEIQLVENLQREDLHPLEEAAGYAELMKVGAVSAEEVGEKVGLSRSWVYSRLNLLKLDGEARAALEDGRLDVSRALVVASVAQPNQRAETLKFALERNYNDKPIYSVRELRAKILEERLTMPLVGAPFDMTDATLLKEMGDCGSCRFRSGNCDPEALNPDVCTNLSCFHLKIKAQAERVRAKALADGRKVLKGEEARKVSPSVKTCYGHIDLDNRCEWDSFPEKEPRPREGVEFEDDPDYVAWREREKVWQPRTYRALLEGEKYSTVLLDDPKTKLLRELVPFKEAQQILKKRGIDLPSYANKKRPTGNGSGQSAESREKEEAKNRAAQAREEAAKKIEAEARHRILKQAFPKVKATLDKATLLHMVGRHSDIDNNVLDLLFDHHDVRKLKEADLVRLLLSQEAIWAAENVWRQAKSLDQLAAQVKVNAGAIRKQVAKEHAEAAKAKK